MLNNKKKIEINDEIYTLTVNRSILYKIAMIIPEVIEINNYSDKESKMSDEEKADLNFTVIDKLYENMNVIFYEMLKIEHKNISLEMSNEIYENFHKEYNDVDEKLMSLIEMVFTQGVPREKKKNVNW